MRTNLLSFIGISSAALGGLAIFAGVLYWHGFRTDPDTIERNRQEAQQDLQQSVVDVTLDEMAFEEALGTLLSQANEESNWLQRWKFRVDIDNPNSRDLLSRKVSLSEGRMSLEKAISLLISQIECQYSVEPGREIVIHTYHPLPELHIVSRAFRVTKNEATTLWGSTDSNAIKETYVGKGLTFPPGTSVKYHPSASLLVITNSLDQLELAEALFPPSVESVPTPEELLNQLSRSLFGPSN